MKLQGYIYIALSIILILLSNIPLGLMARKTPAGKIFPLYQGGAPYDYNVYLSVITLGQNGYWLNRDAFTSENTRPGIFYFFYILVGKMAKIFSLWQPYAYHLARLMSIGLFLTALFYLCRTVLGVNLGFWAAILALTATVSPLFLFMNKEAFLASNPWWTQLESLHRLDGLPHHIFGQALFLFSLNFLITYLKTKNARLMFYGAITIIITGIFFPPAMMPLAFMLPLSIVISLFLSYLKKDRIKLNLELGGIAVFVFSALIPLFISFLQSKQGHPWTVWVAWEINRWNIQEVNFNRDLLFAFNILPIISLPAVFLAFKKNDRKLLFFVFWAYMPFILLPFVDLLKIGKIRLINSTPFVPFTILSVYSFASILKSKSQNILKTVLVILIFVAFTPVTLQSLGKEITSINNQLIYSNIYIPDYVWKTIDYIQQNVPKDSVILSNESVGNIIAAYTPTKAYFGHINQTMNFEEKQHNVWLFLNKEFSREEAAGFIKKNNISYVYLGPEENFGKTIDYPFLVPIFQSGEAVFYKIDLTLR